MRQGLLCRAPHTPDTAPLAPHRQAHIERGRLDDAIDNYQRALDGYRLPPQDAQAVHLALGRVLVNMSLLTQAQRSFNLAAGIKVQQVRQTRGRA